MRLINRKAGVVVGLTVILTFPVTVVSGAGSQKKGETETRVIITSGAVKTVYSPASPDRAHNQKVDYATECQ